MKTRIITALVGIAVLTAVLLTFDTLVFNLVVTAITLIAVHEIYNALALKNGIGRCMWRSCRLRCWS